MDWLDKRELCILIVSECWQSELSTGWPLSLYLSEQVDYFVTAVFCVL